MRSLELGILGVGIQVLGFRVWGFGLRVWGLVLRTECPGLKVELLEGAISHARGTPVCGVRVRVSGGTSTGVVRPLPLLDPRHRLR